MASAMPSPPDTLSVPEMLRIMDVATALRQDRELVEEQLNLNELKARLRERMIAAAQVTGEEVTPEEVDAAIEKYYQNLHRFQEPKPSFTMFLAHVWVRRFEILKKAGVLLFASALTWLLFLSPRGPFTITGRTLREVENITAEINRKEASIHAISQDPTVQLELNRLGTEAATYRQQQDPKRLETVKTRLDELEVKLNEEYNIAVVFGNGRKSGIDRYYTDANGRRVSGYYLIVEAKGADGTPIVRHIHNDEQGTEADVKTWAERVSKEVYDRIARDKKEDGILNETAFAVKRRGFLNEEVLMPGPDGKPLTRAGQITEW